MPPQRSRASPRRGSRSRARETSGTGLSTGAWRTRGRCCEERRSESCIQMSGGGGWRSVLSVLAIAATPDRQRDTYLRRRTAGLRPMTRSRPAASRALEPIDCLLGCGQWGVSPLARAALAAFDPATLAHYPERFHETLLAPALLARFAGHGVTAEQLFLGHGSFNILERILHKLRAARAAWSGSARSSARSPPSGRRRVAATCRCRSKPRPARCPSTRSSTPSRARPSRSSTSTTPTTRSGVTSRRPSWSVWRRPAPAGPRSWWWTRRSAISSTTSSPASGSRPRTTT